MLLAFAAMPDTPQSESPSLQAWTPGRPHAYEMKFLLSESRARDVEAILAPHLSLDPHADPTLDNAYRTTTLYCDTPAFDVFHRVGRHARRKLRLRRYCESPQIFVERKRKRGERVQKRRSVIDELELWRFHAAGSEGAWPGRWFEELVVQQELQPACRVHYLRTAYFGATPESPVRVTFDRDVRGLPTRDWNVDPFFGGSEVCLGEVICEFKFQGGLPGLLKSVVHSLRLSPCGVSKYRRSLAAAGVIPMPSEGTRTLESISFDSGRVSDA